MNHFSTEQALRVWSELWQAYYGENSFGGDTVEIYAYTLRPDNPCQYREGFNDAKTVIGIRTARDLIELLQFFQDETHCRIDVNGTPLAGYMCAQIFDHRWHVKVVRNETDRH